MPAQTRSTSSPIWISAALVLTVAAMLMLNTLTSGPSPAIVGALALPALGLAALWLLGAFGTGILMLRLLKIEPDRPLALGIGIAALMLLDAAAASCGLLDAGGGILAWIVIIVPAGYGIWKGCLSTPSPTESASSHSWVVLAFIPAIATALLAACVAPGWIWSSEFGGYDVLSYHLQLPREWMSLGIMSPLEHNVYSFLPNSVEATYLHMMILRGDAHEAAIACQMLHGMVTIAAAWVVGDTTVRTAASRLSTDHSRMCGIIAAAIVLGTPWSVVTGTMAYNEMFVLLLTATAWRVLLDGSLTTRDGALLGILFGAAIAAKLTAAALVVLPLGLVMFTRIEQRRMAHVLITSGACMLLMLLPWLVRNWINGGNPVFPFASGLFGNAHWSAEQIGIWNSGHAWDGTFLDRITQGFNQVMRYGIGPNPDASGQEPWAMQWSIVPWLALLGGGMMIVRRAHASTARMIGVATLVQTIAWIMLTHIQSRFMLPMLPGAALVIGLGAGSLLKDDADSTAPLTFRPLALGAIGFAIFLWCIQPAWHYLQQRDGSASMGILFPSQRTGATLTPTVRRSLIEEGDLTTTVNHGLGDDAIVLLIGDATPYYFTCALAYTTTWDRGPMSHVMAEHPDDASAWFAALVDAGFTHIVVEPNMLQRWQDSGWADVALQAGVIVDGAKAHCRLIASDATGRQVYALR